MRVWLQRYLLCLLVPLVILPFQIPRIRAQSAWRLGRSTTYGHIDSISSSTKLRVVFYSFEVDGVTYHGETDDRTRFSVGPEVVTFATSDPSVSTLIPEEIESIYRVSVVLAILSWVPLIVVLLLDLRKRFKGNASV